ncbi:metalloregulator ArsR/SmtB family transcription factor, partial [Enterobacter hormaechei subsp. oharae]|nr:metalloregulator ArsR/SmtB family transcription factor [Enterobacter hormaechei subsp. oharae]
YCMRGSVSVGDIAESLQLSQSLVSHHLRLLRSARLVRGERKGKYIFYSIMDHHVSHVLQDMVFHIAEE